MALKYIDFDNVRSECRREIENLEIWLRRLVHQTLAPISPTYLTLEQDGRFVFKKSIRENANNKFVVNADAYARPVDACTFDDVIYIVCHPSIFDSYFKNFLSGAFSLGRNEAQSYLGSLVPIRNNLSHANPITLKQAYRVFFVCGEVIESIKNRYKDLGVQNKFNVPLIQAYRDSFSRNAGPEEIRRMNNGEATLSFKFIKQNEWPEAFVGERIDFEVDIDPSFELGSYTVWWTIDAKKFGEGRSASIVLEDAHVGEHVRVLCWVKTDHEWHRLNNCDDVLYVNLKIFPSLNAG